MVSREANSILKISTDKDLESKVWQKWLHDESGESFIDYFNKIKNPHIERDFDKIREKSLKIERRMKDHGII
ncbi:MAG: hypothetical protein ACRCW9_03865 [Cetobacterium sp.]